MSRRHESCILEFATEFRAAGEEAFDELFDDVDAYFEWADRFETDRDLPEDRVPMTQFLLFDEDRLVGMSRLRRLLIPILLLDGGNIGYEVRPSARRRGYAGELLRRTLEEARRIGLGRALLTADHSNVASIRVIENAGGVPDTDSISPRTGDRMCRFWIDLTNR